MTAMTTTNDTPTTEHDDGRLMRIIEALRHDEPDSGIGPGEALLIVA